MTTLFLNYEAAIKEYSAAMLIPADAADAVLLEHIAPGCGSGVNLQDWNHRVKHVAAAHDWEVRIGGLPPELQ